MSEVEILALLKVLGDLYTRHSQYPPDYFEKIKEAQQLYLVGKDFYRFVHPLISRCIYIPFGSWQHAQLLF